MKILMLTSRFGSGYGMGYSSYCEARALADLGCEITLVHIAGVEEKFRDSRIKFVHLPISKIPVFEFLNFHIQLKRLFKKNLDVNSFDVIYIQSLEFGLMDFRDITSPIFYFARSTMKGLGRALEKEATYVTVTRKFIRKILVYLEQRCMQKSHKILVKSIQMKNEVCGLYNQRRSKIEVIQGGLDINSFSVVKSDIPNLKKKFGIPLNKKVFMYAGRIVPQKGLRYFVKAALQLLKENSFIVVIIGEPTDQKYAHSVNEIIRKSSNADQFFTLGHVDQNDIPFVIACADCLVSPSLYEPFGMVNLQAAALGKWIITTSRTGAREVLQNYSQLRITEPNNIRSLTNAMREVLLDQDHSSIHPFDEQYSWRTVVERLQKVFKN